MAGKIYSNIKIRHASIDDSLEISTVIYKSFKEYESFYTPKAFKATTPSVDEIKVRLKEGPIWIALESNIIVGAISAVARDEGLHIRGLSVLPEKRGKGIGHLLLEEVEKYAINKGFERIFLSTGTFLKPAIHLYKNLGFQPTDDGPQYLHGTELFIMDKILRK